jgi:hypothetical protein
MSKRSKQEPPPPPTPVQAIRAEYANGKTSYSKLAAKFSIGICSAWKIVKRELWKHVA